MLYRQPPRSALTFSACRMSFPATSVSPFNNLELTERLKAVLETPSQIVIEPEVKKQSGLSKMFSRVMPNRTPRPGWRRRSVRRSNTSWGRVSVTWSGGRSAIKTAEIVRDIRRPGHPAIYKDCALPGSIPPASRKTWELDKTPIIWAVENPAWQGCT